MNRTFDPITAAADRPARRPWWRTVGVVLVETLTKVFWEPISSGSPRWAQWPRGLRTIVIFAGLAYLVCTVLVIASAQIRAYDPLVHVNGDTYPTWATTVLLWATVLVLALAVTAALHTHLVFRIVVVIYAVTALIMPTLSARTQAGWPAAGVIGLIVFVVLRARRRFAWFEFPVVLSLIAIGLYVPLALTPFGAGADFRPLFLASLMVLLGMLASPMLVMAGYAPAEVSVTLSEWLLNRIAAETQGSRWRRWVLAGGIAIGLGIFALDLVQGVVQAGWNLVPGAWTASATVVAIGLCWSWLMLRRRPGDPPREPTAWAWEGYAWRIAILWVAVIVPVVILVVVTALLSVLGLAGLFLAAQGLAASPYVYGGWRLLVCAVALVWLVRARRRNERVVPVLLVCFITLTALGTVVYLSDRRFIVPWSLQPVLVIAVGVCLASVVIAAIRRHGVERQAWIALLALLLSALVGRRELLAEPGSLAAGVSGLAVLLIGLLWRVLTDAGITRGDSRAFPMPSRVLLFAANALLGTLVLAYLALTRQENPLVDVETMAGVGVHWIGTSLVLGSILLGLLSTIGLDPPPRVRTQDHPRVRTQNSPRVRTRREPLDVDKTVLRDRT